MISSLLPAIQNAKQLAGNLSDARRVLLENAATDILRIENQSVQLNLVFICTHNSRRSHMAQAWCQIAAHEFGMDHIRCHSCGNEATACNVRTIAALRERGCAIKQLSKGQLSEGDTPSPSNPRYGLLYDDSRPELMLFSKDFSHPSLPKEHFGALFCCDQANEACPVVPGGSARIALSYEDPKVADDTPEETARYLERSDQIAAEMIFLVQQITMQNH